MLLYKAFINGSSLIRIKESPEKIREIAVSDPSLKILDQKIARILSKICSSYPKELRPNRIYQSRRDIHYCKNYNYLQYGDIKSAFESSNILLLIAFNFLFSPISIARVSFNLLIVYYSKINKRYSISNIRRGKLRPGLSTSGILFNITQRNIIFVITFALKSLYRKKGSLEFQIYVDDFVIYSNTKTKAQLFFKLYTFCNHLLCIKVNPQKTSLLINISSKQGLLVERLGIVIWKNRRGEIISSIRNKTVNKYLSRLIIYCHQNTSSQRSALSYTRYLLYGRRRASQLPDYSLFNTFPGKVIWTDNQQKKLVVTKFLNILRKQYPSYFSKTSNTKFKEYIFR